MSAPIDFRTLPANVPVMCIPRVFPNIDEKRISRIFDELNMGEIDHIDIISKTTEKGEKLNRVFVHFRKWYSNSNADTARERLINGKEIKIIYDEPWFWKVSAYRSQRPQQQQIPHQSKPRLQFDDEEAVTKQDEFGRDIRPPNNQYNKKPNNNQTQNPNNKYNKKPNNQYNKKPNNQYNKKPNNQKAPPTLAPALQIPVKKRDI